MKPTLIYDGDCGFCKRWVGRWRDLVGTAVEFGPYQEIGDRFPEIATGEFAEAVQYVDDTGTIYSGAEAVFRLLRHAPGRRWLHWAYAHVPAVRPISERIYRFIAEHRRFAGRVTHTLWGLEYETPTYYLGRWLFLRNLGLIFLLAFFSLQLQVTGLIGEDGILPAHEYLNAVEAQLDSEKLWRLPTLLWWLEPTDGTLIELCSLGMVVGLFAALGFVTPLMLLAAALIYGSLLNVSREFLSFQWDILLIETAILAVLFAPLQAFPRLSQARAPSRAIRWLLWFLLFRLLFMSGVVKLDDATWTDLLALNVHYETQPLPTLAAWYIHQLPEALHKFSVATMFVIEIGVPFLILAPRRIRHVAGLLLIFFQLLIAISGNYTFFNWLTIALCLLLFDDAFYRGLIPTRFRSAVEIIPDEARRLPLRLAYGLIFVLMFSLAVIATTRRLAPNIAIPDPALEVVRYTAPFHLVGSYGLFAHMTTTRPEIIIQGSHDGETWLDYELPWKPGALDRAPRYVAPHQPRLDWQLWFAALSNPQRTRWFSPLMFRLLQGEPAVTRLFKVNPFEDKAPTYIRAIRYEYHFTTPEARAETGNWWSRKQLGLYFPESRLPEA